MTVEKLIEKLKETKNCTWVLLSYWYDEMPSQREESYNKISGFIYGLGGAGVITKNEQDAVFEYLLKRYRDLNKM